VASSCEHGTIAVPLNLYVWGGVLNCLRTCWPQEKDSLH